MRVVHSPITVSPSLHAPCSLICPYTGGSPESKWIIRRNSVKKGGELLPLLVRPIAALKPSINVDFLRGILVAYVAYECYVFAAGLWVGVSSRYQLFELGASAIALTVYIALFAGLLFRPASSAKTVFVFLTLFASLQFAAAL